MSKRDVYGMFNVYGSYVLPLEVAHKVQLLIAEHGFRHDYIHNEGARIEVKRNVDAPEVRVVKGPMLDATMLSDSEFDDWQRQVKDARTIDKECEILAPVQFKMVRGG
jgi:hypothetical protein